MFHFLVPLAMRTTNPRWSKCLRGGSLSEYVQANSRPEHPKCHNALHFRALSPRLQAPDRMHLVCTAAPEISTLATFPRCTYSTDFAVSTSGVRGLFPRCPEIPSKVLKPSQEAAVTVDLRSSVSDSCACACARVYMFFYATVFYAPGQNFRGYFWATWKQAAYWGFERCHTVTNRPCTAPVQTIL